MGQSMRSILPSHQSGGVTSVILILICLGLLFKLAIAVVPAYVGDYQLTKLVAKELKKANDAKWTDRKLVNSLNQQLSINSSYNTKAEEVLVFTNKTPGALRVRLKHQSEHQYYGNTYVVNRFDKEVEPAASGGVNVD